MSSLAEENYLKAIYKLSSDHPDGVSTNAIAELMQTRPASVTDMLKRLADKGFIHYKKYQGVHLTVEGQGVAISTIRKHRLWESFLVQKLGFKWDEVHEVAEELEHITSEKLTDALDKFLGYPPFDPHGDPIPSKGGVFLEHKFRALSELPEQQGGQMCGVKDHSPVFLQYLDKMEMGLGMKISVQERNSFDQSLIIQLNGEKQLQISNEVAKNILIG